MSPEVREMLRYRSELSWWYARLFASARRGESFTEPRPEPRGAAEPVQWRLAEFLQESRDV
jgi:hypothetical protein